MRVLESQKTYFEILNQLGEGLNSCVYTAIRRDSTGTIQQKVALKILKSENSVEFWRQEVESLAAVDSPHCLRVLDFEWLDGAPALILEWVDGITLYQLHRYGVLSQTLIDEIGIQIQTGLIELHHANLCHGDLNLHNVMITNKGQVKLLDFGTANRERAFYQGTPGCRAPEITAGQKPDFWSDLFALGSILIHLGSTNIGSLMAARNERDLLRGHSHAENAERLSQLVQTIQEKMRATSRQCTEILLRETKSRGLAFVARAVCSASLLLLIQHAEGRRSEIPCLLKVGTQKWVSIEADGAPSGFAPFEFNARECEPIVLKWAHGNQKGSLTVTFKPGESKLITDSDLGL